MRILSSYLWMMVQLTVACLFVRHLLYKMGECASFIKKTAVSVRPVIEALMKHKGNTLPLLTAMTVSILRCTKS